MYFLPYNMLMHCVVLVLCLNCVRTSPEYEKPFVQDHVADYTSMFSAWPSMHNAARMLRNRREVSDPIHLQGQTRDASLQTNTPPEQNPAITQPLATSQSEIKEQEKTDKTEQMLETPKNPPQKGNATENITTVAAPIVLNETKTNVTITDKSTAKEVDFNSPGVLKRGFIVFGGFALMAVAYFIFYRRKGKKNDTNNTSTIDANQFRYGVLQSEDQRDNLELSRVPLTMESDEDEDEDLEIFDLEQKKKSLSYVNLQMNDEDIVLNAVDNKDNERDNLLLDIDGANSETLINWSSNGNKSIL